MKKQKIIPIIIVCSLLAIAVLLMVFAVVPAINSIITNQAMSENEQTENNEAANEDNIQEEDQFSKYEKILSPYLDYGDVEFQVFNVFEKDFDNKNYRALVAFKQLDFENMVVTPAASATQIRDIYQRLFGPDAYLEDGDYRELCHDFTIQNGNVYLNSGAGCGGMYIPKLVYAVTDVKDGPGRITLKVVYATMLFEQEDDILYKKIKLTDGSIYRWKSEEPIALQDFLRSIADKLETYEFWLKKDSDEPYLDKVIKL